MLLIKWCLDTGFWIHAATGTVWFCVECENTYLGQVLLQEYSSTQRRDARWELHSGRAMFSMQVGERVQLDSSRKEAFSCLLRTMQLCHSRSRSCSKQFCHVALRHHKLQSFLLLSARCCLFSSSCHQSLGGPKTNTWYSPFSTYTHPQPTIFRPRTWESHLYISNSYSGLLDVSGYPLSSRSIHLTVSSTTPRGRLISISNFTWTKQTFWFFLVKQLSPKSSWVSVTETHRCLAWKPSYQAWSSILLPKSIHQIFPPPLPWLPQSEPPPWLGGNVN